MRLSIVCRVASMKSAENVVAFPPPRPRKDREDLAFLPAALEIVETPPSPIGRSTAVIIMLFFALALTWAAIGTVDIVASAQGKIVPVGGIKVIQPFEAGIVRAIHVRDGDAVKAGDLLVELDPTVSEAERGHIEADLVSAQLDVARLRAATAESGDPQTLFKPPPGADPARAGTERRLLLTQLSEHKAKLASIDEQIRQKEAEQVTVTAAIDKLEAIIPIVQERDDIRRTLYDRQVGSKLNHLETMQSLVEAQKDLEFQKSRFVEAGAALASLRQVRNQTAAEQRRQMLAELAEAERKDCADRHEDRNRRADFQSRHRLRSSRTEGTDQNRYIQFFPLRPCERRSPHRVRRRHHARQEGGHPQPSDRRAGRDQRAGRAGTRLCRPRRARPDVDARRRQRPRADAGHGCDRRDRDRLAADHQLSSLAACPLGA